MSEEKNTAGQQKKKLSPDEQIEKLQEKIQQLKNQKQMISNREKEKLRKQRTRRLIQNGALAEQYLRCEEIIPDAFEIVLKELVNLPGVVDFLKLRNGVDGKSSVHDTDTLLAKLDKEFGL
jgi:TolA-binding protein